VRTIGWVAVAAAAGWASSTARAEDVKALLKRVEERMYYPQAQGLKDLSATVLFEGGGPGAPQMAVKVFWKAPDKKACQVELPPEVKESPMAAMIQGMMEKAVEGIVSVIVPVRLGAQEETYDYAAEADGDLTKITGTRKAGAKDTNAPEVMEMWVDAKATPVKMGSVHKGQRTSLSNLKYVEKDGKLLISEVQVEAAGGAAGKAQGAAMKLEYTQVDSIWLVQSAKVTGGQGGGGGYTVKDHAVNKGVDDAVFAPKPAPAGGMKLPAGMPPMGDDVK